MSRSGHWALIVAAAVMELGHSSARGDDPAADLAPRAVAAAPGELRAAVARALERAGANAANLAGAIVEAPDDEQRGAVAFLVAHLPPIDRGSITKASLLENVALAFRARDATPWARQVPIELFRNDVLPATSLNERRDDWRRDFFDRFLPIARECPSPSAAAEKLNVAVFEAFNVRYHASKRPKPDQSPYESARAGFASCTGLSILLVDACRSVGIPARIVGTPRWTKQAGNHTWVEIWDKEWKFVGACEAGRCNEGWFTDQAAAADEARPENRIYATSFAATEAAAHFPMVWRPEDKDYPAEDVTRRYTRRRRVTFRVADEGKPGIATIRQGGRIVAEDRLAPASTFELPGDTSYEAEFRPDGQPPATQAVRITDQADQVVTLGVALTTPGPVNEAQADERRPDPAGLTRAEAEAEAKRLWHEAAQLIRADAVRASEFRDRRIQLGDLTMRYAFKVFGDKPPAGRSLFLSMHGGGGAPKRVNDQQYENQKRLYQPAEGVYLTPRAPTDAWDLWHQAHIDRFFARLIADLVVFEGVDPDRVYLMGYSAGGDGVYQVAPRLADRFAAASMMAGHPNEAKPLGLRNLPFAIHVGANDAAYHRNEIARTFAAELDRLHDADPAGYVHHVELHPGKAHWMDLEDASALPWMARYRRDTAPKKVVWYQDDVIHDQSYWLAVPPGTARPGATIEAEVVGQEVRIGRLDGAGDALLVRLDDRLLDLDRPVTIKVRGEPRFEGKVVRRRATLSRTLAERTDPGLMYPAEVRLDLDPAR